MVIDENTKISKIISEKWEAIDAIAGISSHFKKLQNPILRKVLASRVSVKDAAKIGGIPINDFLRKLADIGFEVELSATELEDSKSTPKGSELGVMDQITLDVRPIIVTGVDPFQKIMLATKSLKVNQTLRIINVFEPLPLISVLENKGFEAWTKQVATDEFHTFFRKVETVLTDENAEKNRDIDSADSFDMKVLGFGSNIVEIDVRQLEMPEPMVTILNAIAILPESHALFVHHKKVPQFLLPELKNRGFVWLTKDVSAAYVHMLIYKSK
jgi:uncharacterized protein (DUF2249 family)